MKRFVLILLSITLVATSLTDADPEVYHRTLLASGLKTLHRIDRMTGEREAKATYPGFLTNDSGNPIFIYQDGGNRLSKSNIPKGSVRSTCVRARYFSTSVSTAERTI